MKILFERGRETKKKKLNLTTTHRFVNGPASTKWKLAHFDITLEELRAWTKAYSLGTSRCGRYWVRGGKGPLRISHYYKPRKKIRRKKLEKRRVSLTRKS
jgi:hypothetical protein